jgi:hypothetical protein
MSDLTFTGLDIPGIQHTRLRHSVRARRIRIEVRPDRSLLIVVPAGTREDQWLPFVLGRRSWIRKSLQRIGPEMLPAGKSEILPARIELVCQAACYELDHRAGNRNLAIARGGRLTVTTREASTALARTVLRAWLVRQARTEFSARLARLSARTHLEHGRLSIRGQKTRWGSCSAKGDISLNYKLLFLPTELVNHVILHELVHTRHMDHSARFWERLEQYDPKTRQHRNALRQAGRELPAWLTGL